MTGPADRIDIVVVNDRAYPGGGASKVALTSAAALAERGHKVRLLAAMGPADETLAKVGVGVELLGQADLATGRRGAMALQGLWNAEAERRLGRMLGASSDRPPVVHVHSWSKALSPSIFAAIRRAGAPAVLTLHDYGFVCPNAALHDFPRGAPCALKPMGLGCVTRQCDSRAYAHKVWRIARQVSLQGVARAADALSGVVAVSDFAAKVYAPHLPEGLSTSVIPNPIPMDDLGPAEPSLRRTFAYVGRLSREKGVLLLAEAAARAGVDVVFVGDGELAPQIRALNSQARITGWLGPDEMVREIRSARAVVLPALWRETQGMVIPEAFANGVPCVASAGTAPGAAVLDGVTGRLFPNGDVAALAEVLRDLATNDAAVRGMGQEAYDRYWADPPTVEGHIEALERLYRSVRRR